MKRKALKEEIYNLIKELREAMISNEFTAAPLINEAHILDKIEDKVSELALS